MDSEDRLRALMARGFQFVHPTDGSGGLVAVVGVRVHGRVIDLVMLNAPNDVLAMRLPSDEVDILAPARVLWQSTGYVHKVLDELLALPDKAESADQRSRGCWVPVRSGTSRWLPARHG